MYAFGAHLGKTCNFSNFKFLRKVSSSSTYKCVLNSSILQTRRSYTIGQLRCVKTPPLKKNFSTSPTGQLYYHEIRNQKIVGYWLLTCSGMVFVAVVLGGVTRLTESGLSMVTWKFLGEKLPTTEEQWLEEFERYKQFPEFQIKNKEITLQDFKWIWRMEYYHRMWGRFIGLAYLLPAAYFLKKDMIFPCYYKRVGFMGLLIFAQGLMGWYMVKSGLEDRFDGPNDVPRVSQYRLAAHLSFAFVLYASLLRSALELLSPALQWPVMSKSIVPFKIMAHSSKGLVYLTAISGAFVAGLDAGLIYNSFPKMADKWIPDDMWDMTPFFKNFFENPTTVQFDHRILLLSQKWRWEEMVEGSRFILPGDTQWVIPS